MGMVGEACLPSNAYYPRTPDYTLCSGVHVCWSEHSDSSFVYGFMILNYGFGTMTATTFNKAFCSVTVTIPVYLYVYFLHVTLLFITGTKHVFSCINIRQVPREVLKTEVGGRGFQYLPRDLANVNALKNHVRPLLLHKN